MCSAILPRPPRLVTAVCGHGEQQRLSNARLRLTFYNAPVAYCGPARTRFSLSAKCCFRVTPSCARVGCRIIGRKGIGVLFGCPLSTEGLDVIRQPFCKFVAVG